MTTTTKIVIERRDTQRDNWGPFDDRWHMAERAQQEINQVYAARYPQHRFRVVKITTTRETITPNNP